MLYIREAPRSNSWLKCTPKVWTNSKSEFKPWSTPSLSSVFHNVSFFKVINNIAFIRCITLN